MTQIDPKVHAKLQKYVNACAIKMNIGHWDVQVSKDFSTNKQAWAAIRPHIVYQRAYMEISSNTFQLDQKSFRAVIVHELSHILTSASILAAERTGDIYSLEHSTEQVARAIAPNLPLPPKSVCGDKKKSDFVNNNKGSK